ncbi:cob(I)yrinic acid a,c-diamide adenosyltransferase [Hyphococcus sp.]|uniref:cob(I)yrinic acid a,c-diamide adenosyltransferase n=1 Tax=Hyphococcus sp. TaxID=2038636 RepID=UPI003CCC1AF7
MGDPKIYTRGGDAGQTSMLSGERVSKADPQINAVGDFDELSVALGFARLGHPKREPELKDFQKKLYQLSATVSYTGEKHAEKFALDPGAVKALEKMIDDIQETLPPLKDFIYPGQTEGGCRLHQARVVARRVERNLALLPAEKAQASIPYINRLSDLLFVLAREADMEAGADDEAYRGSGGKNR